MFSNTGGFLSPVGSWVINIGVTFTVLRATRACIPKENTHTQGNISIHTHHQREYPMHSTDSKILCIGKSSCLTYDRLGNHLPALTFTWLLKTAGVLTENLVLDQRVKESWGVHAGMLHVCMLFTAAVRRLSRGKKSSQGLEG